jgi:hypothetical protein
VQDPVVLAPVTSRPAFRADDAAVARIDDQGVIHVERRVGEARRHGARGGRT